MFMRIFLKAALSVGFLSTPAVSLGQQAPPHWAYSGAEDPNHWGKLDPAYSLCALGKMQSPIDIAHAKPANLPVLKFDYSSEPLSLNDNGHSI
jgi:carbonic anhydrase